MAEIILEATERIKQPGRFKEEGFVPGVIYGENVTDSHQVKFEAAALKKIITAHGTNAKVSVKFNNDKKSGFIKEVQKNAISGSVIHVDVQIVSNDQELKLQIPIVFKGEDELKQRQLQLQVHKSEITVTGKIALMIDAIHVDVSEMQAGDTITLDNLKLDKKLKVSEKDDAVFGIIVNIRNQPAEIETETETEKINV